MEDRERLVEGADDLAAPRFDATADEEVQRELALPLSTQVGE